MKKIVTIMTAVLLTATLWAQSPEKMSYQAVIRDADNALITNQAVGMQISILQGSADGTAVYTETQTPNTNANGLVSLEIGTGTTSDDFSTIDWANGPFFIKTETDPEGSTSYTITGTSQLLSVPYALHAKTAETITGGITETDPAVDANFDFTDAANGDILQFDGTKWVKVTPDYISEYTVTEDDVTAHEGALILTESQISDLASYLETETDPEFTNWDKDYEDLTNTPTTITTVQADAITANTAKVGVTPGTAAGQMQYWDGTAWVTVAVTENEGATLQMIGGLPTWVGGTPPPPPSVTNPITGGIWMDRNLGATQVATSSTDADAYGDLYQWGRAADGHQIRTSGTTATLSTTDNPGHGDFILATSIGDYDWRNPQNDNLWQGVNGTNNPCPSGYRLPTYAEWEAELTSWSSNNAAGAFASPLKLPTAGRRTFSNGSLHDVGSYGGYWTSTVDGTNSCSLYFNNNNAGDMTINFRADGVSVRCIKD